MVIAFGPIAPEEAEPKLSCKHTVGQQVVNCLIFLITVRTRGRVCGRFLQASRSAGPQLPNALLGWEWNRSLKKFTLADLLEYCHVLLAATRLQLVYPIIPSTEQAQQQ